MRSAATQMSPRPAPARRSFSHGLWVCALLGLLAGCSPPQTASWSGYAEGDYVYIAAPLAGRLDLLAVRPGQAVIKNSVLFTLDAEAERAASAEAAARLANAQAQAANLDKGRRTDEVAVSQAQLAQAQANAALAQDELARQQQLVARGFISRSRLESASAAASQAHAHVAELTAALRVARLPARPDERAATQASANAAAEALRQSQWRVVQKQQTAPTDALVSDVFFRTGEFVAAGQPVLSLLPPANVKVRFFVPESELAKLKPDQSLSLSCDGCAASIAAHVTRVAAQAEYTPPVIYSNAQRAKLVFMVEAYPDQPARASLRPGQPVDVRLAGSKS